MAAIGIPHPVLGQAIVAIVTTHQDQDLDVGTLLAACKQRVPGYMLPSHIEIRAGHLPRTPNGKIDRKLLCQEMQHLFMEANL